MPLPGGDLVSDTAVTPSNNPAATIISNAIAILAAGNAVVFAPHPAAINVCRALAATFHR